MASFTPEALRIAGIDALRRELGAEGVVRFLQQLEVGSGNYTEERWQWLPADTDVDSLAAAIQQEAIKHGQPGT